MGITYEELVLKEGGELPKKKVKKMAAAQKFGAKQAADI
jgi:hypothetical protein